MPENLNTLHNNKHRKTQNQKIGTGQTWNRNLDWKFSWSGRKWIHIRIYIFLSMFLNNIPIYVNKQCLQIQTGEGNGTPLQYSCLENPMGGEPGRLQSMGSLRIRHDWSTSLSLFTFMHWRRKWQPTPVFLPGESQGLRSLVCCRLWGLTESDTTEVT